MNNLQKLTQDSMQKPFKLQLSKSKMPTSEMKNRLNSHREKNFGFRRGSENLNENMDDATPNQVMSPQSEQEGEHREPI